MKPSTTYKLLFIIAFAFFHHELHSQHYVNVGPQLSAGSKYFPTNGKRGVGASIEYIYSVSKRGGVRLNISYDHFNNNPIGDFGSDTIYRLISAGTFENTLTSFRAGYQHFLFKDLTFVYGEAGVSILNQIVFYQDRVLTSFAGGVGHRFNLTVKQVLQLSVLYNLNIIKAKPYSVTTNRNYFTFRAAVGLKFGKDKNRVKTVVQ